MKKIRYLIEAILLAILMGVSKILPVQWASNFGGWVGRNLGPRLAASRKAVNNIKASLPDNDADIILRGMWDNLGRVMMEYPHLEHIARDRTEFVGLDILEKYKDSAAIFFTAHLANWEIPPVAAFTQLGLKFTSVYRAPNNPLSDKMLMRARSLKGELQAIPKSKSGTRNLVKILKENGHIGLLIDQKYNEGIEADFFGRPAMTSPAFVQLAQKFDCPLIPIKIERLKNINFRITILPPLEIKDKSIEVIVAESHSLLEEWIKEKPEQWLWLHRRWNSASLKNKDQ